MREAAIAVLGTGALAAGGVATFVSSNGARTFPRGAELVIDLSGIMDDARRCSHAEHRPAAAVREIFASGGDGERVYALGLIQEEPGAGYLESTLDATSDWRSAFEQGQALTAALQIAPLVGPPGKAQLAEAVRQQLTPDWQIARSTNRRPIAEQLLSALKEEATPSGE
jgi:hypothetical protein